MSSQMKSISPPVLHELMRAERAVTLVDVRSPVEFRAGHVKGAISLPLDEFDKSDPAQRTGVPGIGKDTPLYLTCKAGLRARQAAERLAASGHRNVVLLDGGTDAWMRAGLPMRASTALLSLEQQVQIAIGTLLILKVVFGFAFHELFFVLGALIGAGLITAGITRWCGMAKLMARMPWNRESRTTQESTI
ncbi:MAG: rhodanese-like domain-containing protein [Chromatiaceae bacterium]|nr:rhodanese-like domain-containing protein [Chromatiaceae bacterium]